MINDQCQLILKDDLTFGEAYSESLLLYHLTQDSIPLYIIVSLKKVHFLLLGQII